MEIKHIKTLSVRYGESTKVITEFEKTIGCPRYSKENLKSIENINEIKFLIGLKSDLGYGNQKDVNVYEILIKNPIIKLSRSNKKFSIIINETNNKIDFDDYLYNNNNINSLRNSDSIEVEFKNIIEIN